MVLVAKYFRCLPHLKYLNVSENKLDFADCQVLFNSFFTVKIIY